MPKKPATRGRRAAPTAERKTRTFGRADVKKPITLAEGEYDDLRITSAQIKSTKTGAEVLILDVRTEDDEVVHVQPMLIGSAGGTSPDVDRYLAIALDLAGLDEDEQVTEKQFLERLKDAPVVLDLIVTKDRSGLAVNRIVDGWRLAKED